MYNVNNKIHNSGNNDYSHSSNNKVDKVYYIVVIIRFSMEAIMTIATAITVEINWHVMECLVSSSRPILCTFRENSTVGKTGSAKARS